MKSFLSVIILVTLLGNSDYSEIQEKFKVSGTITSSSSYCGGAAPTEEMKEAYRKHYPVNGVVLYVKKGKYNDLNQPVFDSTVTKNGRYSFDLPVGEYVILRKIHLDTNVYDRFRIPSRNLYCDLDCLRKWWTKGLATVTITNQNIDSLDFHFYKRCFVPEDIPCIQYTGPYPP